MLDCSVSVFTVVRCPRNIRRKLLEELPIVSSFGAKLPNSSFWAVLLESWIWLAGGQTKHMCIHMICIRVRYICTDMVETLEGESQVLFVLMNSGFQSNYW